MKFIICLFFLVFLQISALGQNNTKWFLLANNTKNEPYFIDKSSYKKNKKKNFEIWTKKVFQSGEFDLALFEVNCSNQKQQVLQFIRYNPDGSILSNSEGDFNDWLSPAPGSIGFLQLKYVCNPKNFLKNKK